MIIYILDVSTYIYDYIYHLYIPYIVFLHFVYLFSHEAEPTKVLALHVDRHSLLRLGEPFDSAVYNVYTMYNVYIYTYLIDTDLSRYVFCKTTLVLPFI